MSNRRESSMDQVVDLLENVFDVARKVIWQKIAEIKRIRKEQRRRMKERKKSQARLHFNHVGGIGTTALTPRSIRKVTELF